MTAAAPSNTMLLIRHSEGLSIVTVLIDSGAANLIGQVLIVKFKLSTQPLQIPPKIQALNGGPIEKNPSPIVLTPSCSNSELCTKKMSHFWSLSQQSIPQSLAFHFPCKHRIVKSPGQKGKSHPIVIYHASNCLSSKVEIPQVYQEFKVVFSKGKVISLMTVPLNSWQVPCPLKTASTPYVKQRTNLRRSILRRHLCKAIFY